MDPAYQGAWVDDLMRHEEWRDEQERSAYRVRREEGHRMAVHRNPWEGPRSQGQGDLGAGDQTQIHPEGEGFRSRMQL